MIILIIYFKFKFIVKLIEERHNKYKEITKKYLTHKLSSEREKYESSLEKHLLIKKQEQEIKDEKAFKKYQGYVRNIELKKQFSIIVFFDEREKREAKREKTNSK